MGKRSNSIPNAEGVIEAFGGIRPMAKKMEVAVTTVQGWKKRNAIPAARLSQVLAAAETHDVDLDGVLDGAVVANENVDANVNETVSAVAAAVESVLGHSDEEQEGDDLADFIQEDPIELTDEVVQGAALKPDSAPDAGHNEEKRSEPELVALRTKMAAMEKKNTQKSAFLMLAIGATLLAVLGVFVYLLLGPAPQGSEADMERIRALEAEVNAVQSDVEVVREEQGLLGRLVPNDLGVQIETLKAQAAEQASQAQAKLGAMAEQVQDIGSDVLPENVGEIGNRLETLGAQVQGAAQGAAQNVTRNVTHTVQGVAGSPALTGFVSKLEGLQGNIGGQTQLQDSFSSIQEVIAGLGVNGAAALPAGAGELNAALESARLENPTLGQVFAGVPQEDLKAAALLLGMNQFRSVLNRDGEAFDGDLGALMTLVGSDNPDLTSALERLAPHAASGVLSTGGLANEFKTLAGEAVVASIQGEDVSFQERAQTRMNDLFQVEKNGELVTGTPTQAALAKTQNLLEGGDLAGAIANAQNLQAIDGDAAAVIAPWLGKAQATLSAHDVQGLITQSINGSAFGAFGGAGGFKPVNPQTINPITP